MEENELQAARLREQSEQIDTLTNELSSAQAELTQATSELAACQDELAAVHRRRLSAAPVDPLPSQL